MGHPDVQMIERIVDALPSRLWKPGNLHVLPGGAWHLCVGEHPRLAQGVRTIEWRDKVVARGRRPFDQEHYEATE
jgi:hypothetical protein